MREVAIKNAFGIELYLIEFFCLKLENRVSFSIKIKHFRGKLEHFWAVILNNCRENREERDSDNTLYYMTRD